MQAAQYETKQQARAVAKLTKQAAAMGYEMRAVAGAAKEARRKCNVVLGELVFRRARDQLANCQALAATAIK